MAITFPGESAEYRAARDRLLQKEIEARRALEAVALERRALPPGGVVPQDYVFVGADGAGGSARVKLSELFAPGRDSLAIYSFMFGAERARPCPMCTALLDGLDADAEHIGQRMNLVVVAGAPIERLTAFAQERGWKRLRLLSTAGNSYNVDYHGKNEKGQDETMLNVFQRSDGTIRHFWGAELVDAPMDPGQDHRAMDLFNPVFAMFDFTPEGRGDFYTKLSYPK